MGATKNKIKKEKPNTKNKDQGLDFALKALGYKLPETEEEINAFNAINGDTAIELPEHLRNPEFLKKAKRIEVPQPENSILVSKSTIKPKNDYFKKVVLAAEIANQLHTEQTFGHVKFVKIFCLCNEVNRMNLSTHYEKYAAGPLDPKLMYSIDAEFKKRNWFKITKTEYGYRYEPDENFEDYKEYYPKYFAKHIEGINYIISLLRNEKSDFCEIVATLFFVWKESLNRKIEINNANLFQGFYDWDDKKKRFDETKLVKALNWMKENNIVPVEK